METFYHISNKPDCDWKVGDEIEFGVEQNYMWQSFLMNGDFIELEDEKIPADLIIEHALDHYMKIYYAPMQMKNYHFNPLHTLKEAVDSLRNLKIIKRELVFESIRKEFYPELPSRHKCIWLIPDDEKSLEFWRRDVFKLNNPKIFKLSVDGKTHRASQQWLICRTYSLNEINSMAHKYWQGENSGSIDDEILFVGKIRILEKLA